MAYSALFHYHNPGPTFVVGRKKKRTCLCRIALDTHGTRRAFSLPLERRSRPHPVRAERPPPISPREFSTKAHLGPLNHYRLGVKKYY